MHQRVRAFAIAILQGESADPIQSANLLREITALHPDISALVIEFSAGWARGAASRTASVALVAEVSAASALASLPVATSPSLRSELAQALANVLGEEIPRAPASPAAALAGWGRRRARRTFHLSCPRSLHGRPAGTRSHRRPGGGPTPSVSCPNAHLPFAPGSRAQRPACLSGGADFRHPVFPWRLAVCVIRPSSSGDLCGPERCRT